MNSIFLFFVKKLNCLKFKTWVYFTESSLSYFGDLLYKIQYFSKIQDYFGKSIFGHLFLSIFEKPKYFSEFKNSENLKKC